MKKEIWQSNQPILQDDLDRAQDTKEAAIKERLLDAFSEGVVANSQFLAETIPFEFTINDALFEADIGTGIAYDASGERIFVNNIATTYSASNPTATTDDGIGGTVVTPQSTGNQDVPLTNSLVNYIFITYLQTTDTTVFTLQQTTNLRLFTKGDDGYRIDVVTSGAPVGDPTPFKPTANAIFLAAIDYLTTPGTSAVSITSRNTFTLDNDKVASGVPSPGTTLDDIGGTYAPGTDTTFEDHILAVGSGTPNTKNPHGLSIGDLEGQFAGKSAEDHEKLFHETGIAGDQTSTTSSLFGARIAVSISGGPGTGPTFGYDTWKVEPLTGEEAVNIEGTTADATNVNQQSVIYFVEDDGASGVPLDDGTYTAYLDGITKEIRLAHNGAAPTNDKYRIFLATAGTFTEFTVVSLATVITSDQNFLLWEVDWVGSAGTGAVNNIPTSIDKRFFGTIGSEALLRDSETDTVTIDHNVTITGNADITGDVDITGDLTAANTGAHFNVLPPGMLSPYGGTADPAGWMLCDGRELDSSNPLYLPLFNIIGVAFGTSGGTLFNIPDTEGRFLRSVDNGATRDPDAGSRAASASGGNINDNVGSIQDGVTQSHTHSLSPNAQGWVGAGGVNGHAGGLTTSGPTPTGAGETRPLNLYVNYIIKL